MIVVFLHSLDILDCPPSVPKSRRPARQRGTSQDPLPTSPYVASRVSKQRILHSSGACSAVHAATVPPIEKPASTTRSGGMPHSWPSSWSSLTMLYFNLLQVFHGFSYISTAFEPWGWTNLKHAHPMPWELSKASISDLQTWRCRSLSTWTTNAMS